MQLGGLTGAGDTGRVTHTGLSCNWDFQGGVEEWDAGEIPHCLILALACVCWDNQRGKAEWDLQVLRGEIGLSQEPREGVRRKCKTAMDLGFTSRGS